MNRSGSPLYKTNAQLGLEEEIAIVTETESATVPAPEGEPENEEPGSPSGGSSCSQGS